MLTVLAQRAWNSRSVTQGVGVALTALRHGLTVATTVARRRLLVSLEISNKDRAYEWFLAWMAHQASTGATAQTRAVSWMKSHKLSVATTFLESQNGNKSALFKLVAGPGIHWCKYNGAWMQVCFLTPVSVTVLIINFR